MAGLSVLINMYFDIFSFSCNFAFFRCSAEYLIRDSKRKWPWELFSLKASGSLI